MATAITQQVQPIEYPDSDGEPMSDNTKQFRWITLIHFALDSLFAQNPQVFVAGDLLWYPVEGDNGTRVAPDVMVALGRPKGDRGSYRQWEENGVAPQVVFEIMSPGNRPGDMEIKRQFYENFGVEEYYIYDPDHGQLQVYLRQGDKLDAVQPGNDFTSPLLGIRFELSQPEMRLIKPSGEPFLAPLELSAEVERQKMLAEKERERAKEQTLLAEQQRLRALADEQRANELARRNQEKDAQIEQLQAELRKLRGPA